MIRDSTKCIFVIIPFKFTLPYSHYCPSPFFEKLSYFLVMLNISFPLFLPKFFISLGACIPAIMSVPKTTIYKNCYTTFQEYKVWVPSNRIISFPTCNVIFLEYFN